MAEKDESLIPMLEEGADDVVVTLEPPINEKVEDDSLSSISDAPSVDHFNISFGFKKTFREHEGARAGHSLEKRVRNVYEHVLQYTYRCYVCAFGFILAVLWGLINAGIAFLQTWFISPCLRILLVLIGGLLPIITDPIRICVSACCDACKSTSSAITEKLGKLHMDRA